MPEGKDKPEQDKEEAEEQALVGGERLAAARREQQISVLEVAKELHLDEVKVRALERNEFDVLGAPVFAKGHLRKYAQLVGVDEDDLFTDYFKMTRAEPMPPVIVGRKRQEHELSPGPWIAAIIVILAAAAAYWWLAVRNVSVEPQAPATAPAESAAAVERDALDDDTVVLAAARPDDVPAETDIPPVDPGDSAAAGTESTLDQAAPSAVVPAVSDGQVQIDLTFSGECWTEITDADGRRLFFGMGRAGRETSLIGTAPVTALFGNADNVSVSVNGEPYGFDAAERRGRTARLSISSP